MPDIVSQFRTRLPYVLLFAGVAWLGILFLTSSFLIVWPAFACIAGGLLWLTRPKERISWAWATAAALMGFLLSGYQVLASAVLLTGTFASVNAISLVVFLVFAAVHAMVLYAGNSGVKAPE